MQVVEKDRGHFLKITQSEGRDPLPARNNHNGRAVQSQLRRGSGGNSGDPPDHGRAGRSGGRVARSQRPRKIRAYQGGLHGCTFTLSTAPIRRALAVARFSFVRAVHSHA